MRIVCPVKLLDSVLLIGRGIAGWRRGQGVVLIVSWLSTLARTKAGRPVPSQDISPEMPIYAEVPLDRAIRHTSLRLPIEQGSEATNPAR